MRLRAKILALCFMGFAVLAAQAQPKGHTTAKLLLGVDSARPGDSVMVGVHLHMDAGWHTYWKNPGASGLATKIEWALPAGVTAGEIQWPLPNKTPISELTTYVYDDDVVLLVPLKLGTDVKPGPLELKAKVEWLECSDEQCVPGKGDVQATLNVGTETKVSEDSAYLESWVNKIPKPGDGMAATASWGKQLTDKTRSLSIEWATSPAPAKADFLPYSSEDYEIQPATDILSAPAGKVRLGKVVKIYDAGWPKHIAGVIVADGSGYEVNMNVKDTGAMIAGVAPKSLWFMLIQAFLGGLILNIMPCVLPVIALKILGFVGHAKNNKHHIRVLGFVYALGVLASFLVIALFVIGVKAAGHRIGWGFQFGNPYFLIVITVLVMLISLNLFGVFEITLHGKAMHVAHKHSSKEGVAGAFFNGLLATVLATSCSAPILGTAIGYAFAQPPAVLTLIMLTVGAGLAAPYVVLCWEPQLMKFLPKPGMWMEKFKMAMGFPMLAAGLWCYSLVSTYYGERTLWLGIFLVFVALAAWVFGNFVQHGRRRRGLAWVFIMVFLGFGYAFALEKGMDWRKPTTAAEAAQSAPDGDWQPWSPQAVAAARANGRPVLVDFTAKWCLTCNTIVKPTLESTAVSEKIKAVNAVKLLADYTRQNDRPDITDELARYDRAGVPLVLVFPRDPSKPAIVLPETFAQGTALTALDEAAK